MDSNFSNSLSYTLEQVNTPYVFTFIDDFIFQRQFKVSTLIRGLNVCLTRDAHRYIYHYPHAIFRFYKESENDIFWRLTQDSPYTTSLQWSIWSADFLRRCIKEGEGIQSFEVNGSKRINELIFSNLKFFKRKKIQLLWQCGSLYFEKYSHLQSSNVLIFSFLNDSRDFIAALLASKPNISGLFEKLSSQC